MLLSFSSINMLGARSHGSWTSLEIPASPSKAQLMQKQKSAIYPYTSPGNTGFFSKTKLLQPNVIIKPHLSHSSSIGGSYFITRCCFDHHTLCVGLSDSPSDFLLLQTVPLLPVGISINFKWKRNLSECVKPRYLTCATSSYQQHH